MDIKTLVQKAKAKDLHALEALYNMYYPKMLGLCIKITKEDEDTAKDLVQDAFVLAFSSLHTLKHPQRFAEWLSTIVRNVALKYMEQKAKMNYVSITDEEETMADPNVSSDSNANVQDILKLIDALPNGYAKVLRLYAIDGFSHKEIAAVLGIEPHSSSSQLSRAKVMLRKMIIANSLVVMLVLITISPLYYFILRNKPQRRHKSEMAENNKKTTESLNNKLKPTSEKIDIRKPINKNVAVSNATIVETNETTFMPDSAADETIVSQKQVAEHTPDKKEKADSIMPQPVLPEWQLATNEKKEQARPWQMLAAASIGPALAQNIYQLIATDNSSSDTDTDAPAFPEHVNTWEDYSRYLHMKEHDNMREDTLALIEIADHNQGDIIEREQHDRPITFGISFNTTLSKKWSIETGLQYSILKSRSTMGSGGYYVSKKQSIHYLGIPFRMSYNLANYKHLSAYSSAGLQLNIPIYGKVRRKYVVNDASSYTDSWRITPAVQWSTNFSLGLQYRFHPKWTLYAEPTLYWHIPNGGRTQTIWTKQELMFSVPFGIRFVW